MAESTTENESSSVSNVENKSRSAREEAVTLLERSVSLLRQNASVSVSSSSTTTSTNHSNDDWECRATVNYR